MAEGRKRFLEVFDELEQGGRCGDMAEALSAIADGERDVSGAEAVHVHLRTCGACRAKLRAFRGVPDRVLELLPLGAVDVSTRGQASAWIGERLRARRPRRSRRSATRWRRAGPPRPRPPRWRRRAARAERGWPRSARRLALCGATAAGGAACVAGGVVAPPVIGGADEKPPAIEAEQAPAPAPIDQADVIPAATVADPGTDGAVAAAPDPAPAPTPVEQKSQQFNFEQAATRLRPRRPLRRPATSAVRPPAAAAAAPEAGAQGEEGSASSESVPWPRRRARTRAAAHRSRSAS